MFYIHKFVTEADINHYKSMSNDEIKEMLYIGKDRNNWHRSFSRVIDNDGKIYNYQTKITAFHYIEE
jgi:hypothetical protein